LHHGLDVNEYIQKDLVPIPRDLRYNWLLTGKTVQRQTKKEKTWSYQPTAFRRSYTKEKRIAIRFYSIGHKRTKKKKALIGYLLLHFNYIACYHEPQ